MKPFHYPQTCWLKEKINMAAKTIVFALVSFFHDLFTAIWMGGLIVTAIAFMPSVKAVLGASPQTKKVMSAFQKRQSTWVYISIAGLILTGLLMTNRSPEFKRLFGFGNPYMAALTIKHILVLAMIGVTLYRSLVLGHAQEPSSKQTELLNVKLLFANVVLAFSVLLASGFVTALARPLG
jgi:putative copper export protein